jgi:hypothetical protein
MRHRQTNIHKKADILFRGRQAFSQKEAGRHFLRGKQATQWIQEGTRAGKERGNSKVWDWGWLLFWIL